MLIPKKNAFDLLSLIKDCLSQDKYDAINKSNDVSQYRIGERFSKALKCLQVYPSEYYIPHEEVYNPFVLWDNWRQFDNHYTGDVTQTLKCEYGKLIKDTLKYLDYIITLPKNKGNVRIKLSQMLDVEDETEKLRKINDERNRLQEKIDREKQKPKPDEKAIKDFEIRLRELTSIYNRLKGSRTQAESDKKVEKNISDKISNSFDELKDYSTILDNEKKKIKWEYRVALWLIPILIIMFLVFYGFFISFYSHNHNMFTTWASFLPYTIILPIFVALLWLCVYLKDRANKISIELSTRLFNIHYLEGLMKLTNSVSPTHEDALRKLDQAVESLMHSYLSQVGYNHISEMELSKMEMKEFETNPYWKVIQELKGLIKLIRQ